MMKEEECNVVMLPTEKSKIALTRVKKDHLEYACGASVDIYYQNANYHPQHLYITSDEEIKEGDWIIGNFLGTVSCKQAIKYRGSHLVRMGDVTPTGAIWTWSGHTHQQFKNAKKIIATTDRSLTKKKCTNCRGRGSIDSDGFRDCTSCDGKGEIESLPQIPESFIKAYVKAYNEGNPIDKVEVEYEQYWKKVNGEYPNYPQFKLKLREDGTIHIHRATPQHIPMEELKFIATRFAHACRQNGVVTNNDTLVLWDKWIEENKTYIK